MMCELYLNKAVLKKKERKFGEFSISQNNHSGGNLTHILASSDIVNVLQPTLTFIFTSFPAVI